MVATIKNHAVIVDHHVEYINSVKFFTKKGGDNMNFIVKPLDVLETYLIGCCNTKETCGCDSKESCCDTNEK